MRADFNNRATLRNLPKTIHGGQAWRLKDIEDYSQNLNPFGPPSYLNEIISSSISETSHYPDDSSINFRTAVAKQFSVSPDNVIAGSGSSDIIRMFPNTFLDPGDRVIMFRPSFAEYSQQCKIVGADIEYINLKEENDFRIDTEELYSKLNKKTKALYICNPNNPTGRIEKRETILEIVRRCEYNDTFVFLDETLLELVEGYKDISCASYVNEFSNLIVAGSLTKSFAIPGIRIGFGITSKEIADEMNKVRMTWNIGTIEQKVGEELISNHMDYVHDAAKVLKEECSYMYSSLKGIGFPVERESDSFFYFCDLSKTGMDTKTFVDRMLEHGIMVRNCSSFGKEFENYVRFCVKDRERDDRFIQAVKGVLRQ